MADLAEITGLDGRKMSQFWRSVESKSEDDTRVYRTGTALLAELKKHGADAELAEAYAGVEGKADRSASRPKKPKKSAKTKAAAPSKPATAPDPLSGREDRPAEKPTATNGHVSAPSPAPSPAPSLTGGTGGITKIYPSKPPAGSFGIGDEEALSKIEAYSSLLHSLLFETAEVDMAMVYLAGDVARLSSSLLDRTRPPIGDARSPAEPA